MLCCESFRVKWSRFADFRLKKYSTMVVCFDKFQEVRSGRLTSSNWFFFVWKCSIVALMRSEGRWFCEDRFLVISKDYSGTPSAFHQSIRFSFDGLILNRAFVGYHIWVSSILSFDGLVSLNTLVCVYTYNQLIIFKLYEKYEFRNLNSENRLCFIV